jgi:hypothetical protein
MTKIDFAKMFGDKPSEHQRRLIYHCEYMIDEIERLKCKVAELEQAIVNRFMADNGK